MQFKNLHIISHPLVKQKLGQLRNIKTTTRVFRGLVQELSVFMVYEAVRDLQLKDELISTWNGDLYVPRLQIDKVTIVPIMRAGTGMLSGALRVFPEATVNFLGIVRNENTAEPHVYYNKSISSIKSQLAIVIDPMLATGGSLGEAIAILKKQGSTNIIAISLISAPEGVAAVEEMHPEINVYTASLDEKLNDKKFIIPGLGDAGDRLFGT